MCVSSGKRPTTAQIRQYHSHCGYSSNRCHYRLPPVETRLQLLSVMKPLQFADNASLYYTVLCNHFLHHLNAALWISPIPCWDHQDILSSGTCSACLNQPTLNFPNMLFNTCLM